MPPMKNHIKSTINTVIYYFSPMLKSWSSEPQILYEMYASDWEEMNSSEQSATAPVHHQESSKHTKKKKDGEKGEYQSEMRWTPRLQCALLQVQTNAIFSGTATVKWGSLCSRVKCPPPFWFNTEYSDIYQLSRPPKTL